MEKKIQPCTWWWDSNPGPLWHEVYALPLCYNRGPIICSFRSEFLSSKIFHYSQDCNHFDFSEEDLVKETSLDVEPVKESKKSDEKLKTPRNDKKSSATSKKTTTTTTASDNSDKIDDNNRAAESPPCEVSSTTITDAEKTSKRLKTPGKNI